MNNLYGWVMSDYLPYGGFKWLKNIDEFDEMSISEKIPRGYFLDIYLYIYILYIFSVDLKYPDELHELHNDYPLAPGKRVVSSNMLLKYCKNIADK